LIFLKRVNHTNTGHVSDSIPSTVAHSPAGSTKQSNPSTLTENDGSLVPVHYNYAPTEEEPDTPFVPYDFAPNFQYMPNMSLKRLNDEQDFVRRKMKKYARREDLIVRALEQRRESVGYNDDISVDSFDTEEEEIF